MSGQSYDMTKSTFTLAFSFLAMVAAVISATVNLLRLLDEKRRARESDEKLLHNRFRDLEAKAKLSEELVTKMHGAGADLVSFYKNNKPYMTKQHPSRLLGNDASEDASIPLLIPGHSLPQRKYPELAFLVTLFAYLHFSEEEQVSRDRWLEERRTERLWTARARNLWLKESKRKSAVAGAEADAEAEADAQIQAEAQAEADADRWPYPRTHNHGYSDERGWWATVFLKDELISLWKEILREAAYITQLLQQRRHRQFNLLRDSWADSEPWLRQQAERAFCMCFPAVLAHWYSNLKRQERLWRPDEPNIASHKLRTDVYGILMAEPGNRILWDFLCKLADYSDARQPDTYKGLYKLKDAATKQLNKFFGIEWEVPKSRPFSTLDILSNP